MSTKDCFTGKFLPVGTNPVFRFFTKIVVNQQTGCWEWTDKLNRNGYGRIFDYEQNTAVLAHRFSFELFKGKIPDDLVIDHICCVRRCVNPEHLASITHKDNLLRGNGKSAINARKTKCPKGHEYNKENTYIDRYNTRRCRECRRLKQPMSDIGHWS